MRNRRQLVDEFRKRLLGELNQDVEDRFGGNKAKAAEAVEMGRIQFTNLCNGRDGATIDKLVQIGATLGWKIEIRVERRKDKGT